MNKKDLQLMSDLLEDYIQKWDMTNYSIDELCDLKEKIDIDILTK